MALPVPVVKVCKTSPEIASDMVLPRYETLGAAGMDIRAFLEKPVIIKPLERVRIPTALALEIPEGYEAQVRPRSGLAYQRGVTVLNAPGTIDSDYRGEVCVILVNLGQEPVTINNGDRIAQLVFAPVTRVTLEETCRLSKTRRGECGFGSTGW
ncbi:MAG: dUTP diphosphatase [Treponema sp.]|jgi:dUTP pyrophosphatase|nr:dUTP diphosphatase [Treponema sp.]